MKAVIGVGFMKLCLAGIEVFTRLKFPGSEAVLVHTVEPVLPDGGFMPIDALGPIADIQRQRKTDGEARMAEVAAILQAAGVPSRSITTFGNPAHEITSLADAEKADLVVAGSNMKGGIESFLMGSVSRALVVGAHESILIGKAKLAPGDKINAVLATDHSPYADKCVDLLVRLAPKGLAKVTVVSADTSDASVAQAFKAENPEGLTTEQVVERKNKTVCERIKGLCDQTESVVIRGRANEAITAAMERSRADLLILGAHGHGFVERLMMGSTALAMVANTPHNVLVLRV